CVTLTHRFGPPSPKEGEGCFPRLLPSPLEPLARGGAQCRVRASQARHCITKSGTWHFTKEDILAIGSYKYPDVLVTTDWVAQHTTDPHVRLVEVDVDTSAYEKSHIRNAVAWNWTTQLQDNVRRDLLSRQQFEELLSKSAIAPDSTVVFYGDNNNWFAAYALWQLKYFGHKDARLMNGGRKKWELEGRPWTTEVPSFAPTEYKAGAPDES